MRKKEWFSEWFGTSYYAMLYGERNDSDAKPLVSSILERLQADSGKVWDMACGRGRHLFWFGESGWECFGSDISEQSVIQAQEKVPNGKFLVHDMRQGPAFDQMDLTCNLFTSIGYSEDPDFDQQIMDSAFKSLKDKGVFVLDFMNSLQIINNLVPSSTVIRGDVVFDIQRTLVDGVIQKQIHIKDGLKEFEFVERVRAYSPDDLCQLIENSGFSIMSVEGADMKEHLDDSKRCVIMAEKT